MTGTVAEFVEGGLELDTVRIPEVESVFCGDSKCCLKSFGKQSHGGGCRSVTGGGALEHEQAAGVGGEQIFQGFEDRSFRGVAVLDRANPEHSVAGSAENHTVLAGGCFDGRGDAGGEQREPGEPWRLGGGD